LQAICNAGKCREIYVKRLLISRFQVRVLGGSLLNSPNVLLDEAPACFRFLVLTRMYYNERYACTSARQEANEKYRNILAEGYIPVIGM
jgi:hypothetical protein